MLSTKPNKTWWLMQLGLCCEFLKGSVISVSRATASNADQVFDAQDLWCKMEVSDGLDDLSARERVCWALCHHTIASINLENPM